MLIMSVSALLAGVAWPRRVIGDRLRRGLPRSCACENQKAPQGRLFGALRERSAMGGGSAHAARVAGVSAGHLVCRDIGGDGKPIPAIAPLRISAARRRNHPYPAAVSPMPKRKTRPGSRVSGPLRPEWWAVQGSNL